MSEHRRPTKDDAGRNRTAKSALEECPNKNWVELDHGTEYPDDYGQYKPAANTPFRLTFGDGSKTEGKLDQNGFARFDGIPEGDVHVEYEPELDKKIAELKQKLKQGLDEIIAAEREEYKRIQKELDNARVLGIDGSWSNNIAKGAKYTGALLSGLWNGAVGIVSFAWDVLKGGAKVLYELSLRINPITAPEKFKQDIKALKETYEELKRFTDEDLEAYVILMGEADTYAMFQKFGSDLLDAQHPLEMVEGGGELIFDIALTVITGGAGAAANVRHAGKLKKLKTIVDELIDALKREKRLKRLNKDAPNRKIITRVQLKHVPCFCPFNGKAFRKLSPENRKKYLQEYDRQLQRQQNAINELSADDYLAARQAYKSNGRNPLAADAQEEHRAKFKKSLVKSLMESQMNKNKGMGFPEAKKEAQARAESIMNKLDALHEPDMALGGWSNPDPKAMGDSRVNRAIGGSWNHKGRLSAMDDQAEQASLAGQGDAKMNVKLEVCRGRKHCP
ncbi:hypothetical protein F0U61_52640 [Archangium violaceum]|uniref:polymorphic toxin type 15 domain-containing protein n=1 Tax=Archangium violaceum TaxID=83451 RepID=UPI002B2F7533|nr:hypothetical protein F0U61_52640 [Archangium violaceum]